MARGRLWRPYDVLTMVSVDSVPDHGRLTPIAYAKGIRQSRVFSRRTRMSSRSSSRNDKKLNAATEAMPLPRFFSGGVAAADADDAVRAILVRGEGANFRRRRLRMIDRMIADEATLIRVWRKRAIWSTT